MRVAIYATDEHEEPEAQLPPLRTWCTAGGHEIVEEYVDCGVAASIPEAQPPARRRFDALLDDARQRRFDIVLCWSVAAFTREGVVETLYVLGQLKADGVRFFSYSEPRLDDELFAVMASLVRQERLRHGERTRWGMARARERGKPIGRAPISAATEARIRAALAAGDKGMIRIARELKVGVGTVHRLSREAGGVALRPSDPGEAAVGVAVPPVARVARGPVWR